MGDTNISWTARPRTIPTEADCLHPGILPCLDIECPRCWVKGHTVNPWLGCVERTPACSNCYAKAVAENRMGLDVWGKSKPREIRVDRAMKELLAIYNRAMRTGQRTGVFTGSMCDIFEDREDLAGPRGRYLDRAAVLSGHMELMLLTKRPENIAAMVPDSWLDNWPRHVWVGATIACPGEEVLAEHLGALKARGATTFASVEPMLGEGPRPVGGALRALDLVIIGGESGSGARPFDVEAAARLVKACDAWGTAVWFKQMGSRWAQANSGGLRKGASHGQDPYRWPAWARRREMPVSP